MSNTTPSPRQSSPGTDRKLAFPRNLRRSVTSPLTAMQDRVNMLRMRSKIKGYKFADLHTHLLGMGNAEFWMENIMKDHFKRRRDGNDAELKFVKWYGPYCPEGTPEHEFVSWWQYKGLFGGPHQSTNGYKPVPHKERGWKLALGKRVEMTDELFKEIVRNHDWADRYNLPLSEGLRKRLESGKITTEHAIKQFTKDIFYPLDKLCDAFDVPCDDPRQAKWTIRSRLAHAGLANMSEDAFRERCFFNAREQYFDYDWGVTNSFIVDLMSNSADIDDKTRIDSLLRNAFSMLSLSGSKASDLELELMYRGRFTPEFYPRRFALKDPMYEQDLSVLDKLMEHVLLRYHQANVHMVEFSVGVADVLRPWIMRRLRQCRERGALFSTPSAEDKPVKFAFLAGFSRTIVWLPFRDEGRCRRPKPRTGEALRFLIDFPDAAMDIALDSATYTEFLELQKRLSDALQNSPELRDTVVGCDLFSDEKGLPYCPFWLPDFITMAQKFSLGYRYHCGEDIVEGEPFSAIQKAFWAHMEISAFVIRRILSADIPLRIGHGVAFSCAYKPLPMSVVEKDLEPVQHTVLSSPDEEQCTFNVLLRTQQSRNNAAMDSKSYLHPANGGPTRMKCKSVVVEVNWTSNRYLLRKLISSKKQPHPASNMDVDWCLCTDNDGVWQIDCNHHVCVAAEYCNAMRDKLIQSTDQIAHAAECSCQASFIGARAIPGRPNTQAGVQPSAERLDLKVPGAKFSSPRSYSLLAMVWSTMRSYRRKLFNKLALTEFFDYCGFWADLRTPMPTNYEENTIKPIRKYLQRLWSQLQEYYDAFTRRSSNQDRNDLRLKLVRMLYKEGTNADLMSRNLFAFIMPVISSELMCKLNVSSLDPSSESVFSAVRLAYCGFYRSVARALDELSRLKLKITGSALDLLENQVLSLLPTRVPDILTSNASLTSETKRWLKSRTDCKRHFGVYELEYPALIPIPDCRRSCDLQAVTGKLLSQRNCKPRYVTVGIKRDNFWRPLPEIYLKDTKWANMTETNDLLHTRDKIPVSWYDHAVEITKQMQETDSNQIIAYGFVGVAVGIIAGFIRARELDKLPTSPVRNVYVDVFGGLNFGSSDFHTKLQTQLERNLRITRHRSLLDPIRTQQPVFAKEIGVREEEFMMPLLQNCRIRSMIASPTLHYSDLATVYLHVMRICPARREFRVAILSPERGNNAAMSERQKRQILMNAISVYAKDIVIYNSPWPVGEIADSSATHEDVDIVAKTLISLARQECKRPSKSKKAVVPRGPEMPFGNTACVMNWTPRYLVSLTWQEMFNCASSQSTRRLLCDLAVGILNLPNGFILNFDERTIPAVRIADIYCTKSKTKLREETYRDLWYTKSPAVGRITETVFHKRWTKRLNEWNLLKNALDITEESIELKKIYQRYVGRFEERRGKTRQEDWSFRAVTNFQYRNRDEGFLLIVPQAHEFLPIVTADGRRKYYCNEYDSATHQSLEGILQETLSLTALHAVPTAMSGAGAATSSGQDRRTTLTTIQKAYENAFEHQPHLVQRMQLAETLLRIKLEADAIRRESVARITDTTRDRLNIEFETILITLENAVYFGGRAIARRRASANKKSDENLLGAWLRMVVAVTVSLKNCSAQTENTKLHEFTRLALRAEGVKMNCNNNQVPCYLLSRFIELLGPQVVELRQSEGFGQGCTDAQIWRARGIACEFAVEMWTRAQELRLEQNEIFLPSDVETIIGWMQASYRANNPKERQKGDAPKPDIVDGISTISANQPLLVWNSAVTAFVYPEAFSCPEELKYDMALSQLQWLLRKTEKDAKKQVKGRYVNREFSHAGEANLVTPICSWAKLYYFLACAHWQVGKLEEESNQHAVASSHKAWAEQFLLRARRVTPISWDVSFGYGYLAVENQFAYITSNAEVFGKGSTTDIKVEDKLPDVWEPPNPQTYNPAPPVPWVPPRPREWSVHAHPVRLSKDFLKKFASLKHHKLATDTRLVNFLRLADRLDGLNLCNPMIEDFVRGVVANVIAAPLVAERAVRRTHKPPRPV